MFGQVFFKYFFIEINWGVVDDNPQQEVALYSKQVFFTQK